MKRKELKDMTPNEIKEAVGYKYAQVAVDPDKRYNFPVGKKFAESVGYPKYLLDMPPESMTESFSGVNYPPSFAEMKRGDIILDIGCGAGLDLYIASQIVGPDGKVIGIDIADEMVEKARDNMKKVGITNVDVRKAHSDNIPIDDNSVDVITSNGIYNLSPNKEAVFGEA